MKKWITGHLILLAVLLQSCSTSVQNDMIFIQGGAANDKNLDEVQIPDFYISRYEVTQAEWKKVMGKNPSTFKGKNLPVETISWYDCIEYCNQRSVLEGLEPYYTINKELPDSANFNDLDNVKWEVIARSGSNGYRLPTDAEWVYAAGSADTDNVYSGSNQIDEVAWYWRNSGKKYLTGDWKWTDIEANQSTTKAVGQKQPNSRGLYDMSGNVREWCWDWYEDENLDTGYNRIWRGGGWLGGEHACAISYRGSFEANGKGPDQGFRVVRSVN
ncbi:MAG: formylglycine-generating enzyme family protein [Porphyromonadaceae bacterium]|nr:formylglycine-generating enzyme family protein [Porphyromonadaceae bacterium]